MWSGPSVLPSNPVTFTLFQTVADYFSPVCLLNWEGRSSWVGIPVGPTTVAASLTSSLPICSAFPPVPRDELLDEASLGLCVSSVSSPLIQVHCFSSLPILQHLCWGIFISVQLKAAFKKTKPSSSCLISLLFKAKLLEWVVCTCCLWLFSHSSLSLSFNDITLK